MRDTDVNALIGAHPFRDVPHPEPGVLRRVLEREGARAAWVGHLPSAFHRDPTPGNAELFSACDEHAGVLHPAPVVRADWPGWQRTLDEVAARGAVAVRAYPTHWGLAPGDRRMLMLADACAERRLPVLLTVRFEDSRQRHWMDVAPDLTGAAIRFIVRGARASRVLVTAAGRDLIEEVHWGLTPEERSRLWWDISWIWGPPEDHLAHLLRTIGPDRLVYGTHWPLRLAQSPRANLALLPPDAASSRLARAEDIAFP